MSTQNHDLCKLGKAHIPRPNTIGLLDKRVFTLSARCYHIIMARTAIGLGAQNGKRKVVDLDALRKDTPSRKLKKNLEEKGHLMTT